MKMCKKIACLLLAVLMLFAVAGCGAEEEWVYSDVEETIQTEVEGEAITSTIKTTSTVKKVQNTTSAGGILGSGKLTPQEELFKKQNLDGTEVTLVVGAENQFEKYPQDYFGKKMLEDKWGVTVNTVVYSTEQLRKVVPTLVASGNPPDVGTTSTKDLMRFVYKNLAASVDKYIVKSDSVWEGNESFDGLQFDGKTYGVNWNGALENTYFIYYNKTYFKENGLEDPYTLYTQGKWTVDKFKDIAIAATKKKANGKDTEIYGVRTWDYSVFLAMYGAMGVTENANHKWSVTIDSPNAMKGLQLISDLAHKGAVTFTIKGVEFKNRAFAMHIERGPNAIGETDLYNVMDDEIGMVPLPMSPEGKYYTYQCNSASFFLKGGKNPCAAVAYRYYDRLFKRHSSPEEQIAAGFEPFQKVNFTEEHKAIGEDYIKNKSSGILVDMIYTLENWDLGDDLNIPFWNSIIVDLKQPAQVVDSTKAQLVKCLKDTVQAGNVVE